MISEDTIPLVTALKECAALWAEVHQASLARIGKAVVNDGGFFTRLETQPKGTTTETLERFARFLGDAGNWPDEAVPLLVRGFVERVGVNHDAAPGKAAA